MQRVHDIDNLQQTLTRARLEQKRIALVPTMGNLHQGHLDLVKAARDEADLVVTSIFVNPLQFGPSEDFDRYPRTLDSDCLKLMEAGCDVVFAPSVDTLYPNGQSGLTTVHVPGVSEGLCGARRPGHFDGVATVVSLLFHIVGPDVACFGEKDYQQLAVIRKMVHDLHLPIVIKGVPIAREPDGLALSSRNQYLTPEQREKAPRLADTLKAIKERLENGRPTSETITWGLQQLTELGFRPDYLELRDAATLSPLSETTRSAIVLVAAHLGETRLLDNLYVRLS
ncbi:pantoate--beta-alanine ligase [Larsenimonas suaedae]|uniref:Pantothenate synthetase n=1 Tax=Larsenimonas suaedae TaxID=1851019 RepID=A0ABU1GYB0_9GAMM|nr:pantoate--beta-alanine ligase [Larsenimonas suaedae]MCM2973599.1 pantoate--beta-alanine ligase [Larsenimonas suaedae]MDR5897031.1 pantoate--beta-alanine ligase [Larsenimonas suaedae]